ncbi:MAG: hypothetical protein K2I28_05640 [Muribaculaceae bacterium]|nr:hypothetical protein [Muribaculaceae bacterium]
MNIEDALSQRINLPQIKRLASWASGNPENLRHLWSLAGADNRRTSVNALWVMTHLPAIDSEWIVAQRDMIIDMLLSETDTAKKRLLLQILKQQDFAPENIRIDLLDFCLSKINSEHEPYAIRCFSIYTAFNLCKHYPELLAELKEHLELMSYQSLSPGLNSALRQTQKKIQKLKPALKIADSQPNRNITCA